MGGFLVPPDFGVWGLTPKEVNLPTQTFQCAWLCRAPAWGEAAAIRLAVVMAAH